MTTKIDIGGYHTDPNQSKWPGGSIWASEGQRLYDLVKDERPKKIVEIGAYYGCSTTWITQSIINNKINCDFISIDKGVYGDTWSMIPEENRKYVSLIFEDCFKVSVSDIDLLFEDGAHTPEFTKRVLQKFSAKLVVCHDYLHESGFGDNVRKDFNEVLGEPDEIFQEDSDCGLAIKWIQKL